MPLVDLPVAEDGFHRLLLRRLCTAIASEVIPPDRLPGLQRRLEDTAHSVLLGLHPVRVTALALQPLKMHR